MTKPQVPQSRIIVDSSNKKWLRTEDAGYLDDNGRIWLVGRVKWMVTRNGKTTWSFEVEQDVSWLSSARTSAVWSSGLHLCPPS